MTDPTLVPIWLAICFTAACLVMTVRHMGSESAEATRWFARCPLYLTAFWLAAMASCSAVQP